MMAAGIKMCIRDRDMVVYYKSKNAGNKKWVQTAKILFIGATCFFGTGITVMGYNNDCLLYTSRCV